MTSPDDGDVPSLAAASEKYSIPSAPPRGDPGVCELTDSAKVSFGDLAERSEVVRALAVERAPGDLAGPPVLKNGERECIPGLMGEVAMGTKNGSTTGLVNAV